MTKETENNPDLSGYVPFASAQEAWFWFMRNIEAREDGAMYSKEAGEVIRPCEATDIYKIVHRLHRTRKLAMDHFRILSHYGKRQYAPDRYRPKERRAFYLWQEALQIIEDVLIQKRIVKRQLKLVHSEKTTES